MKKTAVQKQKITDKKSASTKPIRIDFIDEAWLTLVSLSHEIRNQLYSDGLSRNTFIERLEHVIKPVYESAQTLGFKE